MAICREYTVLVINTGEEKGEAADAFTESLFYNLKKRSVSASIHPVTDSEQAPAWSLVIDSPGDVTRCYVNEFFFPKTKGPTSINSLLWLFKAPVRAMKYFWHKRKQLKLEAEHSGQKAVRTLGKTVVVGIDVCLQLLVFACIMPLIAFVIIRPLRRMGNMAAVLYMLAITVVAILLSLKQTLLPVVAWTVQISDQLVNLIPNEQLTFEALFPVVAAVVLGATLSAIVSLVRIARWVVRKLDNTSASESTMTDLSYLIDPLFSASVRDALERQIAELGQRPSVQELFVVSEGRGVLLAYEVLSNSCDGNISKPVYLLTRNLSLAGFAASPIGPLWLLADCTDWMRFAVTTPDTLSWYHFPSWPYGERIVKLKSYPGYKIPTAEMQLRKRNLLKSSNTILIERLISLLEIT